VAAFALQNVEPRAENKENEREGELRRHIIFIQKLETLKIERKRDEAII
jgi:hypothetical protein